MTAARHYEHPGAEEIELTRVLFALSDPLRLAMVRHLAAAAEVDSLELGPDLPRSTLKNSSRSKAYAPTPATPRPSRTGGRREE